MPISLGQAVATMMDREDVLAPWEVKLFGELSFRDRATDPNEFFTDVVVKRLNQGYAVYAWPVSSQGDCVHVRRYEMVQRLLVMIHEHILKVTCGDHLRNIECDI